MKLNICNSVLNILKTGHNSDNIFIPENYSLPLTGIKMGFSYEELVYSLFKIQQFFGIKFDKNDVENYGFNSIEKIINLVEKKLYF